ncbi:MAG: AI-2E family transporter [Proteobacteria bacterium]|nr:AI-2E family transporter [Pseudomonadota bacterium]
MTQSQKNFWFIVSLTLSVVCFSLFYSLSVILMPFITGFVGAYAFNAFVEWLEKWHLSRSVASAFVIVGLIIILTLLFVLAFPYFQNHFILLAKSLPLLGENFYQMIVPFLEKFSQELGIQENSQLKAQLSHHVGDILSVGTNLITNILNRSMALANLLSLVILTPIVMFYLLRDWPKMIKKINDSLPRKYAPRLQKIAYEIHYTLAVFVKGQAKVCLILMVLYSLSLWLIGLEQGIFIGILTGFLSFIPYLGAVIGFLTSIAIAFTQMNGWNFIGVVTLVFVIIAMIEGHFLTPRLIGKQIGLHPVWIIFSLLAGGNWFGFFGIILALPFAAAIGVISRNLYEIYLQSHLYQ